MFINPLVNAVKELSIEIEKLKLEINNIKNKL
jgi:hypothetical protein